MNIQKYSKRSEGHSFAKRAADYIFKKLGIKKKQELERKITFPTSLALSNSIETSKESSYLFSKFVHHSVKNRLDSTNDATKSEQDMFKMKAIMLLKAHNLSIKMIDAFSSQIQPHETADTNIVLFTQTLQPLPGEEIELTGQFKRHTKRSIPLIETFRLQARSHQTGFPHPMQHSGFAFCPSLFPSCPLRPESLPIFYKIHKEKEAAAIALLPRGRFNETAKKTLFFKGEVFKHKSDHFLSMHSKLAESFMKFINSTSNALSPFFDSANASKDPYFFIASTYESFNTHFIKEAKQHLYQAHISRFSFSSEGSKKEELIHAYRHYIQQKKESFSEESQEKTDFILFLSSVFEENILTLFLQEMSEIALFAPPVLNSSDEIVQTALFKQLSTFLDELDNPPQSVEEAEKMMGRELQNDISLFMEGSADDSFSKLIDELKSYYLARQEERLVLIN